MKSRLPDAHLRYPGDEDAPYLTWYEDNFAAVFVALHPFFRVDGLSPGDCDWGTFIVDNRGTEQGDDGDTGQGSDLLERLRQLREDERGGKISPDDLEKLIPRRAETISWSEVCSGAAFSGWSSLNRSLLTQIKSLRHEFEDIPGSKKLVEFCSLKSLFLPTEGSFQILHRPMIADIFCQVGVEELIIGSDVTDEIWERSPTDLKSEDRWSLHWRRMWSFDQSIFVTGHWDSFFTLVCLSADRARSVDLSAFEGFWAQATTKHSWWRDSTIGAKLK